MRPKKNKQKKLKNLILDTGLVWVRGMTTIINLNYSWSDLEYNPLVGTAARPLSSSPFSYPRPNKRDNRRKGGKGIFVLADELFLYTFSFLDPIELITASLVCQEFKRLIHDDVRLPTTTT
jgi:hypothetical protein